MYISIDQFESLFLAKIGELEDFARDIVAASPMRLKDRLASIILKKSKNTTRYRKLLQQLDRGAQHSLIGFSRRNS